MKRPRTVLERFKRTTGACLGLFFILVSLIACWLAFFRCGPTFYAAGFTEAGFASFHEGMTMAEAKALIGPPLEVVDQHDGTMLWTYSNRDDDTCDFEMRWIYFRDGRAKHVVNMRWVE